MGPIQHKVKYSLQYFISVLTLEHESNDSDYEKGTDDSNDFQHENVDDPEGWEHDFAEYLSLQNAHGKL